MSTTASAPMSRLRRRKMSLTRPAEDDGGGPDEGQQQEEVLEVRLAAQSAPGP